VNALGRLASIMDALRFCEAGLKASYRPAHALSLAKSCQFRADSQALVITKTINLL
jgi:hypothetical protein